MLMRNPIESDIRSQFLLDPQVIYLNHGSFGACPQEVFAVYQEWQLTLERQPVEFLGRRAECGAAAQVLCVDRR